MRNPALRILPCVCECGSWRRRRRHRGHVCGCDVGFDSSHASVVQGTSSLWLVAERTSAESAMHINYHFFSSHRLKNVLRQQSRRMSAASVKSLRTQAPRLCSWRAMGGQMCCRLCASRVRLACVRVLMRRADVRVHSPKIRSAATKDCPKMNQTTSTRWTPLHVRIEAAIASYVTEMRQGCEDPGVPAVCAAYLTRSDSRRTIASPELAVV